MAVTAESIYQAAQINPADLGADIVSPDGEEGEQRTQAIAWIQANILDGANAEVSVPYAMASQGNTIPLPLSLVQAKYPNSTGQNNQAISDSITALYDATVTSYGISMLNKSISSNDSRYDEDSDTNRKQADAKLAKLIATVQDILSGPTVPDNDHIPYIPVTVGAKTTFVW